MEIVLPLRKIVSGPSMSGKTVYITKFIKHLPNWTNFKNFHVVWCIGHDNAIPKELPKAATVIRGVPTYEDIIPYQSKKVHVIVVLDDLMKESLKSSEVLDFFSRDSHHLDISIILSVQNICHQSRYARDISLNANYITCLRNLRDPSQFHNICRQIWPINPKALQNAYDDCMKQKYAHFFMNFTQECPPQLRFLSNIFAPYPTVYSTMSHDEDITYI